ncbi:MAG TPA: class IV adenylate cyclase [bacterium]|nr:class IV adenylate cyclase [bacterium]
MEEFEVKYTNIDSEEFREKLKSIGAKFEFSRTYRRLNFEYPDWRLDKENSWLRLRDEGDKITLAFKKRIGPKQGPNGNDLGMQEIETVVEDFDKTRDIFLAAGFIIKYDVENRRERWTLDGIQFDMDEYPLLPPYIEIESSSWEKVEEGIELLGFDSAKKRICHTGKIYKENGIEIADYITMYFNKQIKRNDEHHHEQ